MRLIISTLTCMLISCTADPTRDASEPEPFDVEDVELDSSDGTTASPSPVSEEVTPLSGCNHMQTCTPRVCKQDGCSEGAAIRECYSDSSIVCGTCVPTTIIFLDGRRRRLQCPI